jgi:hypothetical protein
MKTEQINKFIKEKISDYLSSLPGEVNYFSQYGANIMNNSINDVIKIGFRANPRKYAQRHLFIFNVGYGRTFLAINNIWAEYYKGEYFFNYQKGFTHLKLGTGPKGRSSIPQLEIDKKDKDLFTKLNAYIDTTFQVFKEKLDLYSDINQLNKIYNCEEDLSFSTKYHFVELPVELYGYAISPTLFFNRLLIAYYANHKNYEDVYNKNMKMLKQVVGLSVEEHIKAEKVLQNLYKEMQTGSLPKDLIL